MAGNMALQATSSPGHRRRCHRSFAGKEDDCCRCGLVNRGDDLPPVQPATDQHGVAVISLEVV
jgi:hypothetical protein